MAEFLRILVAAHRPEDGPPLERVAGEVRSLASDAVVRTVHVENVRGGREVLDALLSSVVEHRADLLVMGARSHVLASRAAMIAPCSVLMVPDGARGRCVRILVPVDFSHHSGEALRAGAALAARSEDAEAVCVFIESHEAPWRLQTDDELEHAGKLAALEDFMGSAIGRRPALRCLCEPLERSTAALPAGLALPHAIEGADIAHSIVQVAMREKADLIVIGTRGRSRSAAVLLGSVTEKVIHMARCPLLAIKKPGANLGLLEVLFGAARAQAIA